MLQVGKLYICEYFLLLYPDQEAGDAPSAPPSSLAAGSVAAAIAAAATDYWSNQLGKPVFYTEKNIPLLVLNSKEKYIEVLAGDKTGWIVCNKWLELKEIK